MKLVFEGFVDYGEDNQLYGTIKDQTHQGELADHAFVFIFWPYRYNWIQPIACYATKGSCSVSVIQQLMARAICALHQHGAVVKSVVCDGAQSNKLAMKLSGVTGKYGDLNNAFQNKPSSFEHPTINNKKIFFFIDVPHLMKTVLNNIFTN